MLRSLWVWTAVTVLIVVWLPFLALVRLFDRDPALYRTGYWFRRLGRAMTYVNPSWKLEIAGHEIDDPRRPYVVVSNHQSFADIPVISCLPWEMKWVAKTELFRIPFVGWMMRLAGDVELDRRDPKSRTKVLLGVRRYLQQRCSVIFFPEGTRSRDGRVSSFNKGAFVLAIKEQLPVLPIAVDGTRDALPKHSWHFGPQTTIHLQVLSPIETAGLTRGDAEMLSKDVRLQIIKQIAEWRGVSSEEVDGARPAQEAGSARSAADS